MTVAIKQLGQLSPFWGCRHCEASQLGSEGFKHEDGCPASIMQMDLACLSYLVESGGSAPTIAIPAKLFSGEICESHPSLVDLGFIEHDGEVTRITAAGRAALADMTKDHNTK